MFKVLFYFFRIPENRFSRDNNLRNGIDIKIKVVQGHLFSEYPNSE